MSQKIENAREALMRCGREFLLRNPDGSAGKFHVRDLTAQCGMALGTFYHYFDSKDDLARQIVREDWLEGLRAIDAIMRSEDSLYGKVKRIYMQIGAFERAYRYSALNLFSPTEENRRFQAECFGLLQNQIRDFLQSEIEKHELQLAARPETAAYLLIQLFRATATNPDMSFEDLWMCMNFRDTSERSGV